MTVPGPYGDQTTDAVLAAQGAFAGPALEAVSEAKVVALEQAVDCSRWMDLHDHEDPVGQVLAVAGRFEEFLTGKETP